MATSRKPKLTARTVVTLNPDEKKLLHRRAREENISASEVLRRSFRAYTRQPDSAEDEAMRILLAQVNEALDHALEATRSSRVEIQKNLAEIRARQQHSESAA